MAQPPQQQQDRNQLWSIFTTVDKDRSGKISANELQSALSNGTWRPFNIVTVNMMISLFDRSGSGIVDFDAFCGIWGYVNQWSGCFRSFDRDNSGRIDRNELKNALTSFGYRLSDQFIDFCIKKYDKDRNGQILFDDFIQICLTLQKITDIFRQYDTNRSGNVTMGFEQFLTTVFGLIA